MKKCPCMHMTLTMCDHSNDEYGKGMKSHEWLLRMIARQMLKDRGGDNRKTQKQQINKRGVKLSGGKTGDGSKDSITMKDGRLKMSVICRRWLKDQCPFSRGGCQYLHPKKATPAQQRADRPRRPRQGPPMEDQLEGAGEAEVIRGAKAGETGKRKARAKAKARAEKPTGSRNRTG
eukprot:379702-Pyramimonas_sp.AAC.1